MTHQFLIPAKWEKTVTKVNSFFHGFLPQSPWYDITKLNWTAHGLQVFVKPFPGQPYEYCLMVQATERMPGDVYKGLFKSGRPIRLMLVRQDDGSFVAEIATAEYVKDRERILREKLAESW